ncbi:DNA/RNA non-specific endonuclease [Chitinophaga silvisoli]|uniref:DNA/RNA non-specific endonuclease n=1 Tax=Chitinophaga silvisoli TaxID=2291814 RepID=A0A3E1P956_9BACT|nr:DNA/RNA non-specific endonuclease [Chitinophaga silvisoli]RFM36726.1 DNA/RNA non-specific endonuclease [Chitinophaga silvisoli]
MKAHLSSRLLYIIAAALIVVSCRKDQAPTPIANKDKTVAATTAATTTTLSESFESGTKTAYATGNVTLSSGSWSFDDALIGILSTDAKNGSQSARIRNTGSLTMNFDATGGATTITIAHAVFGSDGSSTWQLWISTNGGSSYSQVGSTVTSSSTTLSTATFTVNVTGSYRLSIRKASGGTNRINIDDVVVTTGSSTGGGGTGTTGDNSHLLLGNPSGAVASSVYTTNYLYNATYYIESYNSVRGTPNWVSWHLNSADIGSTSRQDDFRANTALPSGWYQVDATSYSGSGFDRGHNCPSGDRTSSVAANSSTFLMTNMIPQAPNNNQVTWEGFESYIRTLVSAGNECYIIMGSYGTGGTGSNGTVSTIDGVHVTVPGNIWKVVVVLSNGNGDLSRITTSTRVIAINTPNNNSIGSDWKSYRTSVDAIESATGYDLLSAVSTTIQATIEAKVDNQ